MEVKTSLLDNMIGVGDMVLLEPLTEDTFLENLKNRFDHNEIYVSIPLYIVLAVSQCCDSATTRLQRQKGKQKEGSLKFNLIAVFHVSSVMIIEAD